MNVCPILSNGTYCFQLYHKTQYLAIVLLHKKENFYCLLYHLTAGNVRQEFPQSGGAIYIYMGTSL